MEGRRTRVRLREEGPILAGLRVVAPIRRRRGYPRFDALCMAVRPWCDLSTSACVAAALAAHVHRRLAVPARGRRLGPRDVDRGHDRPLGVGVAHVLRDLARNRAVVRRRRVAAAPAHGGRRGPGGRTSGRPPRSLRCRANRCDPHVVAGQTGAKLQSPKPRSSASRTSPCSTTRTNGLPQPTGSFGGTSTLSPKGRRGPRSGSSRRPSSGEELSALPLRA